MSFVLLIVKILINVLIVEVEKIMLYNKDWWNEYRSSDCHSTSGRIKQIFLNKKQISVECESCGKKSHKKSLTWWLSMYGGDNLIICPYCDEIIDDWPDIFEYPWDYNNSSV